MLNMKLIASEPSIHFRTVISSSNENRPNSMRDWWGGKTQSTISEHLITLGPYFC